MQMVYICSLHFNLQRIKHSTTENLYFYKREKGSYSVSAGQASDPGSAERSIILRQRYIHKSVKQYKRYKLISLKCDHAAENSELIPDQKLCEITEVTVISYKGNTCHHVYCMIWSCMYCHLYDEQGNHPAWNTKEWEDFLANQEVIRKVPACKK